MSARDWLLREPSGTTHVTQYVPTYMADRNRAFVLPKCWTLLADTEDPGVPETVKARRDRTAMRRRLRPVSPRTCRVTCLWCISWGLT